MKLITFRLRVLHYAVALHNAGWLVWCGPNRADGRPVLRVRQPSPG